MCVCVCVCVWQQCTMGTVCCLMELTALPRRLLGLMPVHITPLYPLAWCRLLLHLVLLLPLALHLLWILWLQSHQPLLQVQSRCQLLRLPRSHILLRPPLQLPGVHPTVFAFCRTWHISKVLYLDLFFFSSISSRPPQSTVAPTVPAAAAPVAAIIPPPPDIQPVIDKLAEYVARNGVKFESSVRAKNDPR